MTRGETNLEQTRARLSSQPKHRASFHIQNLASREVSMGTHRVIFALSVANLSDECSAKGQPNIEVVRV